MTAKVKESYRDSLFKIVFGEHKENALSLYNAINGTSYTNSDEFVITTIKDAIYIGIKNDVSFLLDYSLNLYEHQNTVNPNMPLRGLEYFADLYKNEIEAQPGGRERIYRKKLIKIPTPKYYVFYTGTDEQPERSEMHLSDAYEGEGDIEIVAHMININRGRNEELLAACKPLGDYSEFIQRIRDNKASGMSDEEAISVAIDSCIRDDILESLLKKERGKVTNSLLTALTEEEIKEMHEMDIADARAEGIEQGIEQSLLDSIKKLINKQGITPEEACRILDYPFEKYCAAVGQEV